MLPKYSCRLPILLRFSTLRLQGKARSGRPLMKRRWR